MVQCLKWEWGIFSRPAASASPGNSFGWKILRSHPGPTEPEAWALTRPAKALSYVRTTALKQGQREILKDREKY